MELSPPYELVGRIVCEASAVEAGLLQCARQAGADPAQLGTMRTRGVLKFLTKTPHPDDRIGAMLLKTIDELFERRDVVAHGAPLNVWGKSNLHGFAKPNRPTGEGYVWFGFEEEELTTIARELSEIAEVMRSVVLTHADQRKPD